MTDTAQLIDPAVLPPVEPPVVPKEPEVVAPPELSTEEQVATDNGWVPKDQWKGDPDSWRPAKEFNDRGEFFKRIDRLEHKNKELQQALSFLTDQQKRQYMAGFNDAINKLRAQRDHALEEGDNLQAQRINDKIDEVKEKAKEAQVAMKPAPAAPPEPSATYTNWATRNSWYTKDKVLTKFAEAIGATFKEENPQSSEADMLRHVETEVKREFAHKFGPKGPPSPDGDGRGATNKTSGTGKYSSIEGTLTSEQKTIMNTIIKTTGMTKEEYLKQYSGQ